MAKRAWGQQQYAQRVGRPIRRYVRLALAHPRPLRLADLTLAQRLRRIAPLTAQAMRRARLDDADQESKAPSRHEWLSALQAFVDATAE